MRRRRRVRRGPRAGRSRRRRQARWLRHQSHHDRSQRHLLGLPSRMSEPASYPPSLPAPLYQGSVNTWECDDGGHLNVRFHLERMMIGLAHFAHTLEMPHAFTKTAGATLVPLEAHLRFLKEARPGAPQIMHGGVVSMGENEA